MGPKIGGERKILIKPKMFLGMKVVTCVHLDAGSGHCWILEAKMDIALGLHFICPDGRGGHPLTVCQNIKDHLCSIIPWPIRWQGYDTAQMILGILGPHQRVSSSPAPVARI